jgi:hypothetical protein
MTSTTTATSATSMTSVEAYEQYRLQCGGAPVLSEAELRVEIRAAGLRYEELDDTFRAAVLRRPDHVSAGRRQGRAIRP